MDDALRKNLTIYHFYTTSTTEFKIFTFHNSRAHVLPF